MSDEVYDDEPVELTTLQALDMLPDGDTIHTFRQSIVLLGANWSREKVVSFIQTHPMELAGPVATAMGHGLAGRDEHGVLFFATRNGEFEQEKKSKVKK